MLAVIGGSLHVQPEDSDTSYAYLTCVVSFGPSQSFIFQVLTRCINQSPGHPSIASKTSWISINLIQGYCSFRTILISRRPQAIYNLSRSTFIWVSSIIWVVYVTALMGLISVDSLSRSHKDWLRVFLERLALSNLSFGNSIYTSYALSSLSSLPNDCHQTGNDRTSHASRQRCPLICPFHMTFPSKYSILHLRWTQ